MRILSSASKIVFLLLALTVCAGFLWGKLEAKDFMVCVLSAFTFYFSNKGTGGEPPYLGK